MFKVSVRSTAAMRTAADDQNSNSASQTGSRGFFFVQFSVVLVKSDLL